MTGDDVISLIAMWLTIANLIGLVILVIFLILDKNDD